MNALRKPYGTSPLNAEIHKAARARRAWRIGSDGGFVVRNNPLGEVGVSFSPRAGGTVSICLFIQAGDLGAELMAALSQVSATDCVVSLTRSNTETVHIKNNTAWSIGELQKTVWLPSIEQDLTVRPREATVFSLGSEHWVRFVMDPVPVQAVQTALDEGIRLMTTWLESFRERQPDLEQIDALDRTLLKRRRRVRG